MPVECGKPNVVIMDALKLRCAGTLRLLEDWAGVNGLRVTAVMPFALSSASDIEPDCRMVILNVGGLSVNCRTTAHCIESILTLLPDVPLVIVSDDDRAEEAVSAFRAGARGFVPTSMEPALALQAFTFILGGGSYFPPEALLSMAAISAAEAGDPDGAAARREKSEPQVGTLTVRQKEVINLLRKGLPNKLIARHLNMTEATVKVHVRQIMRKLGAHNRTQAALCAVQAHDVAVGVSKL